MNFAVTTNTFNLLWHIYTAHQLIITREINVSGRDSAAYVPMELLNVSYCLSRFQRHRGDRSVFKVFYQR